MKQMRYENVIIYPDDVELIVDSYEDLKAASDKQTFLAKLFPDRKLIIRVHEYELTRL